MNHVAMLPSRVSAPLHAVTSLDSFWAPIDDFHDGDDDGDDHRDAADHERESKGFWLLALVVYPKSLQLCPVQSMKSANGFE